MTNHVFKMAATDCLARGVVISVLIGACLIAGPAIAEEHQLSDRYSLEVDPSAKEQMGEEAFNEVMAFFNEAERAVENRDLEALMDLYSENYADGEHDKKSAEQIWKRIFSTFDTMATHHNMSLVNISPEKNMVIMRCSGLLLGVPDPERGVITIDNWNLQEHVLIKEVGKWKLIGTYGRERKRLWFDKPMHPLF